MTPKRKYYSQEFKDQAVEIALSSDESLAKIARKIEVNENTLYNWVKQKQPVNDPNTKSKFQILQQQLHRTQIENKRLRKECAILRKTASFYFSQEVNS